MTMKENIEEGNKQPFSEIFDTRKKEKTFLEKGLDCLQLCDYEEAIFFFDKAIKLDSFAAIAWEKKAVALQKLGRINEAINANNIAMNIHAYFVNNPVQNNIETEDYSNQIEFLSKEGIKAYNLGEFPLALKYFEIVLMLNPNCVEALNVTGSIYRQIGNFNQALDFFNQALKINSKFYLAWNNKGNCLYQMKEIDSALECFNKTLEIEPNFELSWNSKGRILLEKNELDEALKCFDKALEINPKLHLAWYNIANVLTRQNNFEKALIYYDKALEIAPNLAEIWNDKGNLLSGTGKFEEALICYNKTLEFSNQQLWMAWVNRGIVLLYLQGYESAIQNWDEGLQKIEPNHPEYQSACGHLHWQKAKTYYNQIKLKSKHLNSNNKIYLQKALISYNQALEYMINTSLTNKRLQIEQELLKVKETINFWQN